MQQDEGCGYMYGRVDGNGVWDYAIPESNGTSYGYGFAPRMGEYGFWNGNEIGDGIGKIKTS